jgi:drug/metabolite transporter (DMT)-like permease
MTNRDLFYLTLLAAMWGASFLFMRVSVPEFGAVPMMAFRVLLAGFMLLPLVFIKRRQQVLKDNWKVISTVGVINSAIPFSLIAYSTLYVTAGFASVLNAATPIFASLIAFLWLGHRLSKLAAFGLLIGVFGVTLLVWNKLNFSQSQSVLAIAAGLGGTLFYGIAANYSKQKLLGVDSLSIASGSLIAAGIALLPFAIAWWPQQMPSTQAWINLLLLSIACTAYAQLIYFKLLETAGATNATTVTFLIPLFGLLWGYLFLDEIFEVTTLVATLIILLGTGLTTGLLQRFMLSKKPIV